MTDPSYLDGVLAALPFGEVYPPVFLKMFAHPMKWDSLVLQIGGGPPGTQYDIYWGDPGVPIPVGVYPPGAGFSLDEYTPGAEYDGSLRTRDLTGTATGGETVNVLVTPSAGGKTLTASVVLGQPPA
jgi:hypothetical protein